MEIKDIVEKALKGEDYAEDTKDFDATKLRDLDIEIAKAAKAEAAVELERVTGLRKEKQRLEGLPPEKKEEKVTSQFRDEQLQLAKEKFFADPKFKLTDDQKVQFEQEFKKLDSGKIAADLIIGDLKKTYAVINSEQLLSSQDKVTEFERNAAEYNAGQAGGAAGGGSPDDSKYSEAAKDLHKRWLRQGVKDKTLDDAQAQTSRGENWQSRDLAS